MDKNVLNLLTKVAQYVELAAKENQELTEKVASLEEAASQAKEASAKVEVPSVDKAVAAKTASVLVETGLLSKGHEAGKAAELENPAALADTLQKVATLFAQKPTAPQSIGSVEKVASNSQPESALDQAKKRFATSVGVR